MLKTCPTCGRMHRFNEICPVRVQRDRLRQAQYDRSGYSRSSDADRFRSSKQWQRKRMEIRSRDLNLCRYCFLVKHRITVSGLSVHHIVPLEKDFDLRMANSNLITLCRSCHEAAEKGLIEPAFLYKIVKKTMKIT